MKKIFVSALLICLCHQASAAVTKLIDCGDDETGVVVYRNPNQKMIAVVHTELMGGATPNFKYPVTLARISPSQSENHFLGANFSLTAAGPHRAHLVATDLMLNVTLNCK